MVSLRRSPLFFERANLIAARSAFFPPRNGRTPNDLSISNVPKFVKIFPVDENRAEPKFDRRIACRQFKVGEKNSTSLFGRASSTFFVRGPSFVSRRTGAGFLLQIDTFSIQIENFSIQIKNF